MNFDTDMQYTFTHAIEQHLDTRLAGDASGSDARIDKRVYDPRAWGRKAELAMAARVQTATELLGSSGRTLAR
jgi:fructose-bisphosphate aldolase, class II